MPNLPDPSVPIQDTPLRHVVKRAALDKWMNEKQGMREDHQFAFLEGFDAGAAALQEARDRADRAEAELARRNAADVINARWNRG